RFGSFFAEMELPMLSRCSSTLAQRVEPLPRRAAQSRVLGCLAEPWSDIHSLGATPYLTVTEASVTCTKPIIHPQSDGVILIIAHRGDPTSANPGIGYTGRVGWIVRSKINVLVLAFNRPSRVELVLNTGSKRVPCGCTIEFIGRARQGQTVDAVMHAAIREARRRKQKGAVERIS